MANRVQPVDPMLEILQPYSIIRTPCEPQFDELVALAARICETPMSLINFVFDGRQWSKAAYGTDPMEIPVDHAFCPHALANRSELLEVCDATLDERFAATPLVTSEPRLRYYAGVPFLSREGVALGALCVLDTKPRPEGLTQTQREALRVLANQVSAQLELRRAIGQCDVHAARQRVVTEELRWIAQHDPLTGLANRNLFRQRLEEALSAEGGRSRTALMMLDVDYFKDINDTLGHDAGDCMLQVIAERLQAVVRASDTVARLGGDEFGVVLQGITASFDLDQFTRAMLDRLEQPIDYHGRQIDARFTIGTAIFPDHTRAATDLIRFADVALYAAKAAGRSQSAIFEPAMLRDAERKAAMIGRARQALADDAIVAWYQPQVDLASGRITGFEALLRLRGADGGFELPGSIVAAFDDAELALRLGNAMMKRVATDVRGWLDAGAEFGRVAINASASEFRDDNYAGRLLGALAAEGVPPTCIDVEVTETVFLDRDGEFVERALRALVAAGVRIALDDFGTGYASLSHLGRFPVDIIKVDRSFVDGLSEGRGSAVIVNAILDIAANLGLETVAEGIETHADADYLRKCRCQQGQGYLFGMPQPASNVPGLLVRDQTARSPVKLVGALAAAA